jgi:hypothetical protein
MKDETGSVQRCFMGHDGSDRNFANMRKAQDANTTFHREAIDGLTRQLYGLDRHRVQQAFADLLLAALDEQVADR